MVLVMVMVVIDRGSGVEGGVEGEGCLFVVVVVVVAQRGGGGGGARSAGGMYKARAIAAFCGRGTGGEGGQQPQPRLAAKHSLEVGQRTRVVLPRRGGKSAKRKPSGRENYEDRDGLMVAYLWRLIE
jgi:hypothetical protein